MPFLVIGAERVELRPGRVTLGGHGGDAIPLAALSELPAVAVISLGADSRATIRRLGRRVSVRVGGKWLGAKSRKLYDGAPILVGKNRLTYESTAGGAGSREGVGPGAQARTELVSVVTDHGIVARVVDVESGRIVPVPSRGLVIGRGHDSDLVLEGNDVSRRHATVSVAAGGFRVADASANGTLLNGKRLVGERPITHGDVLRIGARELRFELDPPPDGTAMGETDAEGSAARSESKAGAMSATALAALEVVGGPLDKTRFIVERPVCAIGRGEMNDVRVIDESVSSSHATIMWKDGTWFVTDLRSANGTFIDGYRVGGERVLPSGSMLGLGDVRLRFQPVSRTVTASRETRPPVNLLDRIARRMR